MGCSVSTRMAEVDTGTHNELINNTPQTVRQELAGALNRNTLLRPVMRDRSPDEIDAIINAMQKMELERGGVLITNGDNAYIKFDRRN